MKHTWSKFVQVNEELSVVVRDKLAIFLSISSIDNIRKAKEDE